MPRVKNVSVAAAEPGKLIRRSFVYRLIEIAVCWQRAEVVRGCAM
jgi:hypothetical protein